MVYKKFIFHIAIRISLLTIVIFTSVYFLIVNVDYIKAAFGLLIILLLIFELFRYVNKSNRDFRDFIHLLKNNDFSTRYNAKGKGQSFEQLYEELNQLSKKFHRLSFEKELKHRHLQTVLSHLDIGIISFDSSNTIHIVNHALKELLGIPYISEQHPLEKLDPNFVKTIKDLKSGGNFLFHIKIGDRELHLALQANVYKLKEEEYKLVSVKNIIGELEQKELESYQKLIRVLTHEIMNSITPIASLSNTLDGMIKEQDIMEDAELAEQVKEGISAIHDRSSNLLAFTQSYRKLTRLPQPKTGKINVEKMIHNTMAIVKSFPGGDKIKMKAEIDSGIMIQADGEMMEQVLINIYKNAIEALDQSNSPAITTKAYISGNQRIHIKIQDNGQGMKKEIAEKIFIPFYTTKKEGSGIGLSLCRQIILAHHGHIKADSEQGEGTTITIVI